MISASNAEASSSPSRTRVLFGILEDTRVLIGSSEFLEEPGPLVEPLHRLLVLKDLLAEHLMAPLAERDLAAHQAVLLEERPHHHVGGPEVVPRDGGANLLDAGGVEFHPVQFMHKDDIQGIAPFPWEDSIMSKIGVTPCAVIVDEAIDKGSVEISKKLFKRYVLSPGDEVLVSRGGQSVRVVVRRGDSLKACEIASNPYLAAFMGLDEGDEVDVQGALRIEQGSSSDTEAFSDILGQPQERLEPLLGKELRHFSGLTVEEVLEHLIRYEGAPKGAYLVVAPNPDGIVIPRGEACEAPSIDVKVWDPSGDGA